MLDLPFRPDPQHPNPLHWQLADPLAGLIAAGQLPAGEELRLDGERAPALLLWFAGLAPGPAAAQSIEW